MKKVVTTIYTLDTNTTEICHGCIYVDDLQCPDQMCSEGIITGVSEEISLSEDV